MTKQLVLLNVKTKEREIKKKPKTIFYRTIEFPHANRTLTVDFANVLVGQLNHNPPPTPTASLMVGFFLIYGDPNRKETRFGGTSRSPRGRIWKMSTPRILASLLYFRKLYIIQLCATLSINNFSQNLKFPSRLLFYTDFIYQHP